MEIKVRSCPILPSRILKVATEPLPSRMVESHTSRLALVSQSIGKAVTLALALNQSCVVHKRLRPGKATCEQWLCAGQKRFPELRPMIYSQECLLVLLFDNHGWRIVS